LIFELVGCEGREDRGEASKKEGEASWWKRLNRMFENTAKFAVVKSVASILCMPNKAKTPNHTAIQKLILHVFFLGYWILRRVGSRVGLSHF